MYVGHQPIQLGSSVLATALAAIDVLANNFPAPLLCDLAQLLDLSLGVLLVSGAASV